MRSSSPSLLDDLTLIRNEPPRGFERPRPEAVPAGPAPAEAKPAGRRGLVIGGVLILLPVLVAGGWWGLRTSSTEESAAETTAARPALPEPLPASIPASTEAAVSGPPAAATPPPATARPQPKASAVSKAEKVAPAPAVEGLPAVPDAPFQRGDLIRPGPGVEVPVPFDIPPYSYPAAARGTGKKASIRVALLVDEEGQVIEAQVREGDKSGLGFNEVALETARKVRFQPPSKGDVPGKMWTELILDFSEPATQ